MKNKTITNTVKLVERRVEKIYDIYINNKIIDSFKIISWGALNYWRIDEKMKDTTHAILGTGPEIEDYLRIIEDYCEKKQEDVVDEK